MAFFDVDFNGVVWSLIPGALRGDRHFAWLKVLTSPVRYVYGLFSVNRATNLYELAHNGQVCYLTAVLNDAFDNALRRIYIDDAFIAEELPLFVDLEDKPIWLGLVSEAGNPDFEAPIPLFTETEITTEGANFIVFVPLVVSMVAGYDVDKLTALVNEYKLAGKIFNVQIV